MTREQLGSGYARALGRTFAALSIVAALFAPTLGPDSRNAVWLNSAAILGYVTLERLAAKRWPDRPISLVRGTLLLVCVPVLFLIVAFFIEGDVTYANPSGRFSHADGAWLVAAAGLVLHLSCLLGAALAGKVRSLRAPQSSIALSGFSREFYVVVAWLVLAFLAARLTLLFYVNEMAPAIGYFLRVFLGNSIALFIFLGMAFRLRLGSARLAAAMTLLVSVVVLLSGSRADALLPSCFLAIGYVIGGPVDRRKLVLGGAVAAVAFLLSMSLGSVIRDDDRGRTGQAVGARLDELGSKFAVGSSLSTVTDASIRRMISDSAHSVITRVPSERPFEENGLVNIPQELWTRFVPRFNLSGTSETETPRNWMLNDFGFLVIWTTSVELTLVADAWYRGGVLGLALVGFLLGLVLQTQENLVYRAMGRRPQYSAVLFFSVSGLLLMEGRDTVSALRGMIFLIVSGLALVGAATLLERRRRPSLMSARPLHPPAIPTTSRSGCLPPPQPRAVLPVSSVATSARG